MVNIDFSWLVGPYGIIGAFLFTFLVGLIPFVSPSNAIIALGIALAFPDMNRFGIGLAVAAGATTAKTIHFTASYGTGKIIEKRRGKKRSVGKYGRLTMYILNVVAAATPLPDEWIVIPMGLSKVNVVWFVLTYFTGKLIITVPSAYLGNAIAPFLFGAFGENGLVFGLIFAAIGVVITVIFIVVDMEKVTLKILRRLGIIREEQLKQPEDNS